MYSYFVALRVAHFRLVATLSRRRIYLPGGFLLSMETLKDCKMINMLPYRSVDYPKTFLRYKGVRKGRSDFFLSFRHLIYAFFDFRQNLIEGFIFLTESIQSVLKAHEKEISSPST